MKYLSRSCLKGNARGAVLAAAAESQLVTKQESRGSAPSVFWSQASRAAILSMVLLGLTACTRDRVATEPDFNAPVSGSITNATGTEARIVTPAAAVQGRIATVNSTLRFVVITFAPGQMPPAATRLGVYRNGLKVGELVLSQQHTGDSAVADIAAGDAQAGDQVRPL